MRVPGGGERGLLARVQMPLFSIFSPLICLSPSWLDISVQKEFISSENTLNDNYRLSLFNSSIQVTSVIGCRESNRVTPTRPVQTAQNSKVYCQEEIKAFVSGEWLQSQIFWLIPSYLQETDLLWLKMFRSMW